MVYPDRMKNHRAKKSPRLTPEIWADAALEAIEQGGLSSVAVEPLARLLGVTKGSFYWHFENRDALIRAAMRQWEKRAIHAIAEASRITDPRVRLRSLILSSADRTTAKLDLAVSLVAGDPRVRPFARRVDRRWLDWAEAAYREMGHTKTDAKHWALSAYSAYGGLIQILRLNPDILKSKRAWAQHARHVAGMLVP